MWEDIKSVSVVLFVLLYWVHSSIHYPAWPQGYTRAAFLSNSSLPCTVLVEGREKRKDVMRLKNKCWQKGERRQSPAGHADLQPALPRCSLESVLSQHPWLPRDGESWRLPKPDVNPVFFGEMVQIHKALLGSAVGSAWAGGTGKESRSQLCSPTAEPPWGWGHPQTEPGDGDVGLHLPPVSSAGNWGSCVSPQPCEGLIKTTTKYRQKRQNPKSLLFLSPPPSLPCFFQVFMATGGSSNPDMGGSA